MKYRNVNPNFHGKEPETGRGWSFLVPIHFSQKSRRYEYAQLPELRTCQAPAMNSVVKNGYDFRIVNTLKYFKSLISETVNHKLRNFCLGIFHRRSVSATIKWQRNDSSFLIITAQENW